MHAKLKNKRKNHSSVVINEALWVLGGHGLNSTEYIYVNGTVVAGPNLPVIISGHCSVTLNDGKVMIIGGSSSLIPKLRSVLIFSPNNNSFTTGPSLIHHRSNYACTHFYSPMHDNRPVVLSAGGKFQFKAEILDYTTANAKWEQSKHCCLLGYEVIHYLSLQKCQYH